MGLDIIIISRDSKKNETESFNGLSRTFCLMLCDLVDMKTAVPELKQLFNGLKINSILIEKANVWEIDKKILNGEEDFKLTKKEVDDYYENSWQSTEHILMFFEKMYAELIKDLSILRNLKLNYDWISSYFNDFLENKGKYIVDRNFGWDLRNLIQYLRKLEPKSEVRFHFF